MRFDYTIQGDLDFELRDGFHRFDGHDLEIVAQSLSGHSLDGLEMAARFETAAGLLMKRVTRILGVEVEVDEQLLGKDRERTPVGDGNSD